METFIQIVANDIIKKFGTNLRDITVVFPNKRAGLFMNQQLSAISDRPVWAPKYQTISELFTSLSRYTLCDDIMAICELYDVYASHVDEPETLDRFYGWGEIMLSDFDDIDKHLADTSKLFKNIQEIKELDNSSYLTPEQEKALKNFFKDFSIEGNTQLKERFLKLWNQMGNIYTEFNERIKSKGMLYEGALYKDVINDIDRLFGELYEKKTYIFVGFNVLNEVEKSLFQYLKEKNQAVFYWDYDIMYTNEESTFEAGTFIRQNLQEFPNALPVSFFDNLRNPKHIEFVATTSNNAQARYIPQWLKENATEPAHETAIVLCDELLLQPVLHSLPDTDNTESPKYTNITMGFPLTDTPLFTLVNALLSLQIDGYDKERNCFRVVQTNNLRRHPFFHLLNEKAVFTYQSDNHGLLQYVQQALEDIAQAFGKDAINLPTVYKQMYNEALYRTHNIISRFITLESANNLQIHVNTLQRLIRNVLSTTKIPFHGEPAVGLQIMGVLETRNLNFKHILMLSVNEGMLPKNVNETSFIPYNLRDAFGLTTAKHKIAVYAFYFYRLQQRTERITYTYNITTDGLNKNEMSRFLRQLLAETDLEITSTILESEQQINNAVDIEIEKTPEVMHILLNNYDGKRAKSRPLSPSALNTYLDCPVKFYYQQIAGIRKPKDPQDGLDAALFGSIFHEAAELIYRKLTERNNVILKKDIDDLLEQDGNKLLPFVREAFLKVFFDNKPESVFYNGQLLLAKQVIISYLKQLLTHDSQMSELKIKEMEQEHFKVVDVTSGDENISIKIGGRIDRIDSALIYDEKTDMMVETMRVVDYKTGGKEQKASSMQELIEPHKDRPSYIFQIFLYAWVLSETQTQFVSPALFFVHKSHKEDYDPTIIFENERVRNFARLKDEFREVLQQVLTELFNPEIPFKQTTVENKCTYCDYKSLCKK